MQSVLDHDIVMQSMTVGPYRLVGDEDIDQWV